MRKLYLTTGVFIGLALSLTSGQPQTTSMVQQKLDSLKVAIQQAQDDQIIENLRDITQLYMTGLYQLDSASKYALQLQETSIKLNDKRGIALSEYYLGRVADGKGDYVAAISHGFNFLETEAAKMDTNLLANGLYSMANIYIHQGNLEEALNYQLQVLRLDEASGNQRNIGLSLNNMGIIMKELNRDSEAIEYLERTLSIFEEIQDKGNMAMALSNLGGLYARQGDQNKALQTYTRSLDIYQDLSHDRGISIAYQHIGLVERNIGQYEKALKHIRQSIAILQKISLKKEIAESYQALALVHRDLENIDSARIYLLKSHDLAKEVGDKKLIRNTLKVLSDLEADDGNYSQAYGYFQSFHAINDSIFNESTANRISQLETQYAVERQESEISNLKSQQKLIDRNNRTLRWALIASIFLTLFVIAFLTYRVRTNRKLLSLEQTQNRKVEKAYMELKNTQSQLIQSEKMASLGELTAGIAHEIQNPLNFVNNFSEVNKELITELKDEIDSGNLDEIKMIINDLKANEGKINLHGKRADAIVKSMLQHSRTSTGEKELTNVNALCDEYLRLAYHGFRAKDKSFNANFKLDLDESLPSTEVVPQDIGRVLLNLINNAFQAVSGVEKPEVVVTTKKLENAFEISVKDNGPGIPNEIKDKIFQPFFTTKAAGQGTGLGLSLAYDIVKAHGGEITVDSELGQGSAFIIYLPVAKGIM